MAAETTADPTARDLLRIAVDYARRAEAGDTTAPVGGLAELFGNLARTAALIESTAPVEVDEFPDSVQCQTCGHLQGLHMQQTGCLACNRRGGLCETPYCRSNPGRSSTGESAGTVNVRPLRPVNRGRFKLDGPTDAYPAVRREQAGTFGPPDVDATAEFPRVGNYGPGQPAPRCTYRGPFNNGPQCLLDAGHLEGPNGRGHAFGPLVTPDDIA